jgi:CxxC motif-containing protein (DUF1111 family)
MQRERTDCGAEGEKRSDLLRDTLCARNKLRTATLWGLRLRSRLMHDGASVQPSAAIRRHKDKAEAASERFSKLTPADQNALLAFLQSL